MMGQQPPQSLPADWRIMGALNHVAAGLHIALDDDGTTIGDRDVKAQHDPVRKQRVRPRDHMQGLVPARQDAPGNGCRGDRMCRVPGTGFVDPGIRCAANFTTINIDPGDGATLMEIVDGAARPQRQF